MAAEQDLKLEGGAAPEEPPKGGKKKLILIIVLVLVVLGVGGGAAAFFLLGGEEEAPVDGEDVATEVVEEAVDLPAQYVILKPEFVISFQVGTRQRFLQVSIEIMTRHQSVADALALHEPMVRNEVIRIISAQPFEELRTAPGRLTLQETLKTELAQIMLREAESDDVEAVLFTNFVMQ